MKLLLVEDERDLSDAVLRILKHNGFNVDTAYDGMEALEYLDAETYDGVILDIMMPKLDGISVVKKLRERGNNVPVLLLTAKAEVDDRVLGLNTGADDYLTKPFAMKELVARIRAITRRRNVEMHTYKFGNISISPETYEVTSDKGSIRLTRKEYQMLELLMLNSNTFISTERFMERVWDYDSEAEINVVWVFISALRKKLDSIGSNVGIKAARSIGYKLEIKD